MPRQGSNATDEKDTRVTAAVHAYLEKKYKSITKAAKAFNAPVSTVKHRVRGRQTRVQSHEQQKVLTTAEEDELVRWIMYITYRDQLCPRLFVGTRNGWGTTASEYQNN